MRHRSSVAVVESDQGELHLVLSPARSIDTHVVRCAPRIRRTPFLDLPRSPAQSPILRFRATRVSQTDVSPSIPSSSLVSRAAGVRHYRRAGTRPRPRAARLPQRGLRPRAPPRARLAKAHRARGARSWDAPPSAMSLSSSSRAKFEPRWSSPTVTRYSPSSTRDGSAPTSATPQPCSPARERASVQSLTEIPIENLYFYCETYDVTRAFAHARESPSRTLTRSGYGTTHSPRPPRARHPGRVPPLLQASLSREDSPTRAASSGASPSLDEDRPRTRARGISRADSTRTPRPETRWRWSSSCGAKEARTWT